MALEKKTRLFSLILLEFVGTKDFVMLCWGKVLDYSLLLSCKLRHLQLRDLLKVRSVSQVIDHDSQLFNV